MAGDDELRAEGHLLDSMQLEPPAQAKSLRMRDNTMSVMDGPFAEAKDFVGGFSIVDADDIAHAVELAKGCPNFAYGGSVEVRPLLQMKV